MFDAGNAPGDVAGAIMASEAAPIRRSGTYRLLTLGNPKVAKGSGYGYLTAVLHFAPADLAGRGTVCVYSTPGCRAGCLNKAGRGGIVAKGKRTNAIQRARVRRTRDYFERRDAFMAQLHADIARLIWDAARHGLKPALRINGTSDLPGLAHKVAAVWPTLAMYDYTKLPKPWVRERSNYRLTFSRAENNDAACLEALAHGVNVAVVFDTPKGRALPATWNGYPVVDGDKTDLRFLDPRGVVVGLRAKGPARRDRSGFVVRTVA